VLRLARIDLAEYRGDDDDMVTASVHALAQGWLQSHGLISSIPIDNGPVAMWLLLLPLAITSSLLLAQVWVALLNVASVACCYYFVQGVWGRRLAVIATALYAVSPWAVIYSRRLWITAFDMPLALLAFWSFYRWLRAGPAWRAAIASGGGPAKLVAFPRPALIAPPPPRARTASVDWPGEDAEPVRISNPPTNRDRSALREYLAALLCGLAFSAFFQAHVVPMGQLVTLLAALMLFRRAVSWRATLVCLSTLAVTMAPYVVTTVLPALSRTLSGQQARHPAIGDLSWYFFGHLVTGRGYQSITPQASRLLDATSPLFTALDWLAVFCLAVGVAASLLACVRAVRSGEHYSAACKGVLLLWALVPPAGLTVQLVDVHPYYFVTSMPAIYILEAVGMLALGSSFTRIVPPFPWSTAWLRAHVTRGAAPAALIVLGQLILAVPFFVVLPEYWSAADYGLPLRYTQQLVADARAFARGGKVVVGGFDHDVDYTLYSTLRRSYSGARYADDRGILEYATAGAPVTYLTTNDMSWTATELRANFANAQLKVWKLSGEGKTLRIIQPGGEAMRDWVRRLAVPFKAPLPFSDVAEVDGAAVQPTGPGETAYVLLDWRLRRDPPEPLIMRVDLAGVDGYVWASANAVSYPAGYWTNGDATSLAFLSRIALPLPAYLPPGPFEVRILLLGIGSGRQYGGAVPAGQLIAGRALPSIAAAAGAAQPLPNASALPAAPGLTLAGWQVDRSTVQQSGTVGVVLFWRVTGPVTDLPLLQLVGASGSIVSSGDSSELLTALPLSQWPAGRIIADRHLLHIGGRADTGQATLQLTSNIAPVSLGQITIQALPRLLVLPLLQHKIEVTFGDSMRLAGYARQQDAPAPGSVLRLTLYWQAVGLPPVDETVFVHLVDAAGHLVAQSDGPPSNGEAPTSTWVVGQVIADPHVMTLPSNLPPGDYRLQVGVYNLQTSERLRATGSLVDNEATQADLETIHVAAGGR